MRFGRIIIFLLLSFSFAASMAGVVKQPIAKAFILSIGISGDSRKTSFNQKYVNAPCATCISDAKGMVDYFNAFNKRTGAFDTVINYSFLNKDMNVDMLYDAFRKIQLQASSEDIFIFYYSGSSWGMRMNAEDGKQEGYYMLTPVQKDSSSIGRYSFTLKMLKALTDRVAAESQLIIFDTGNGQVIAPDYYRNFFSDNAAIANFTKKNRIVLCPEHFSSESIDERTGLPKGDMFKVISSLPDDLNVFALFLDDQALQTDKLYKEFMKEWYTLQTTCLARIKVLHENEYLKILTAIKQPEKQSSKRGSSEDERPEIKKVDSSFENRKKKALIIATNIYEAPGWNKLKNPVNDGRAVARELRMDYGYEVDTLFNATGDDVLDAITRFCEQGGNPYSQYIIYFAGHGFYDPSQKTGYVVCRDSKTIKERSRPSMVELKSYLDYTVLFKKIDASLNKVVLITDVCFGGVALNSVLPINTSVDPNAGKDKMKNPFKRVLASGITEVDDFIRLQNGQASGNSPFAAALIDILKKKKDHLSFESLYSEIAEKKLSPDPVDFIFGAISKPSEFIF